MFHRPHPTDRIAVPDTQAVLTNTTKADIRLLTRQDIEEDNREMTDLQTGNFKMTLKLWNKLRFFFLFKVFIAK